jgi:hypothetical protein
MMSKKILIVGDSWGCGEWQIGKGYQTNHPYGLEHFLPKEYLVKNLSIPSGSNIQAVKLIEKYHHDYDTIIWIVTEPSRNFIQFVHWWKADPIYLTIDNKKNFLEQSKTAIFNDIKMVKSICGGKTIAIGGLHKIRQEYYTGFKKVINWVNLLGGSHLETYYIDPQIYQEIYFPLNLSIDKDDFEKRNQFCKHMYITKDFFFPDCVHPNRKSQEILYNNIKDYI